MLSVRIKRLLLLVVLASIVLAYNWNPAFTSGLQYVWLFDEGSGSIVHDRYASATDLTLSGGTWAGPSQLTIGAFDTLQSSADSTYSAAFTYMIWLKRTTISFANAALGEQMTSNGDAGSWFLYFASDNTIRVDLSNVAGGIVVSNSTLTDTSSYHSIALTRTGSSGSWTYKIYLDGVLDKTQAVATDPSTSNRKFDIGFYPSNNWGLEGVIQQAAFWNREVNATDIGTLNTKNTILAYQPGSSFGGKTVFGGKTHR